MTIYNLLKEDEEKFGSKPALIYKDETISFQQLRAQTHRLANVLITNHIGKADKVGIFLPNCPQYAYAYLGIFSLGAVGVPLDIMLKGDELISCLGHSECKILIAQKRKDIDFQEILKELPHLEKILFLDSQDPSESLPALMAEASQEIPEIEIRESEPSLIMYTSGTTGRPKGILLNYKHLDGSPAAMKHFVDLTDQDVKIAAIPLSHIGGFIYLQNCIHFGITVILMDRFNPFEFVRLVQEYKVTCFHIVPPMYNAILTLKNIDQFDLSSLRWVVVFGAPSSPEIMRRFHQYCPNAKLLNGWGMTETCPPNTVTPMDSDNIASVGKPAPHCDIRIVDEDGKNVSTGTVGEVVINGWILMDEYYKDSEESSRVKHSHGLHTGDLGRIDDEGFLYIVGRKKEMIKVAGQIVYAPEVEAALHKMEDISEVAVIGIPDSLKGEAVKAFIVLNESSEVKSEDIRYFARQHLANFKVPHEIKLCNELPKNRTGKIDKEKLKSRGGVTPPVH